MSFVKGLTIESKFIEFTRASPKIVSKDPKFKSYRTGHGSFERN